MTEETQTEEAQTDEGGKPVEDGEVKGQSPERDIPEGGGESQARKDMRKIYREATKGDGGKGEESPEKKPDDKPVDDKKQAKTSDKGDEKPVDDKKQAENSDKKEAGAKEGKEGEDKPEKGAKADKDWSKPPANMNAEMKKDWDKLSPEAQKWFGEKQNEAQSAKLQSDRVRKKEEYMDPIIKAVDAWVKADGTLKDKDGNVFPENIAEQLSNIAALRVEFGKDPVATLAKIAFESDAADDLIAALQKGGATASEGGGTASGDGGGQTEGASTDQRLDRIEKFITEGGLTESIQGARQAQEDAGTIRDFAESAPNWDALEPAIRQILPGVEKANPDLPMSEMLRLAFNSADMMYFGGANQIPSDSGSSEASEKRESERAKNGSLNLESRHSDPPAENGQVTATRDNMRKIYRELTS